MTVFNVERPERRKVIPGYGGRYEVSDLGRVYTKGGFALSLEGGRYAHLCRNGQPERIKVAYLVARAFLPNPEGRMYVWHKDGDFKNCRVENLEWRESRQPSGGRKSSITGVVQYDAEGSVVGVYGSVREASEASGIAQSLIRRCAKGDLEMTRGYVFRVK